MVYGFRDKSPKHGKFAVYNLRENAKVIDQTSRSFTSMHSNPQLNFLFRTVFDFEAFDGSQQM